VQLELSLTSGAERIDTVFDGIAEPGHDH